MIARRSVVASCRKSVLAAFGVGACLASGGGWATASQMIGNGSEVTAEAAVGQQYVYYAPNFDQERSNGLWNSINGGTVHYDYNSAVTFLDLPPASNAASAQPAEYSGMIVTPWDGTQYPVHAQASGTGTASASGGKLHASAAATVSVTPISYTVTNQYDEEVTLFNPLHAKATVEADAVFQDTVRVQGSLPYNTPVQIRLTATLESAVSDPAAPLFSTDYTYAQAQFSAYGTRDFWGTGFTNGDGAIRPNLNGVATREIIIDTFIGDVIDLQGTLRAQAVGIAGYGQGLWNDTAFAEAGDTAILNLDVLTEGATLASDNGTDYSTPVPEPALAGVTAVALAFGTSRAGRRRSR